MRATRQQNYLAILIILGIVATLGLRIWSGHHAQSIYGPKLVAANPQSVYVVMNGSLYHLDRFGVLQDAVSLDAIGFAETPCDMQALADGRLMVGNREARAIYLCDGDLSTCQPFYALPAVDGRENPGRAADWNAFDFYFDVATERLFIVDAILLEFTIVAMSKGSRSLVLDQEDLALPSDIWVDHRGTARIADTLRQRIAGVITAASQFKAFYTDYPGALGWPGRGTTSPSTSSRDLKKIGGCSMPARGFWRRIWCATIPTASPASVLHSPTMHSRNPWPYSETIYWWRTHFCSPSSASISKTAPSSGLALNPSWMRLSISSIGPTAIATFQAWP